MAIVWDGLEYRKVSEEEADRLVEQDKAQRVDREFISGSELRLRSSFTGYHTKEKRSPLPPVQPAYPNKMMVTEPRDSVQRIIEQHKKGKGEDE